MLINCKYDLFYVEVYQTGVFSYSVYSSCYNIDIYCMEVLAISGHRTTSVLLYLPYGLVPVSRFSYIVVVEVQHVMVPGLLYEAVWSSERSLQVKTASGFANCLVPFLLHLLICLFRLAILVVSVFVHCLAQLDFEIRVGQQSLLLLAIILCSRI